MIKFILPIWIAAFAALSPATTQTSPKLTGQYFQNEGLVFQVWKDNEGIFMILNSHKLYIRQ
jgi:hypothetical protein